MVGRERSVSQNRMSEIVELLGYRTMKRDEVLLKERIKAYKDCVYGFPTR